jgi:hypothetical protein
VALQNNTVDDDRASTDQIDWDSFSAINWQAKCDRLFRIGFYKQLVAIRKN